MELKDTLDLMCSDNYKDRFKAEYIQLKIRHEKLKDVIRKYNTGALSFTLSCPIQVFITQERAMREYLDILKIRSDIEDVELD